MKITLYKNCKLNNSYTNVFAFGKLNNKDLIDLYLSQLEKTEVYSDYSYYDKKGQLIFEYNNGNILEYNYMKIESYEDDETQTWNLKRYCFIDSIIYKNELVYLNYTEDIWHSYGSSMNITKSFLSRNRLADKTGFYINNHIKKIPLNYLGNNNININKFEENYSFNVFVEIQFYNGTRVGEVNQRSTKVVLIEDDNLGYDLSLKQAQELSNNLISAQSLRCVSEYGTLTFDYYYNVNEIYIVPSYFNLTSNFILNPIASIVGTSAFWLEPVIRCTCYDSGTSTNLNTVYSKTITNNYKIKSIGTLSNQIPIIPNGINYTVNLQSYISVTDFKLFLNLNNSLIEITNNFKYIVPFTAVNGEINESRKLNRIISNAKDVITIATEIGLQTYTSSTDLGFIENSNSTALSVPQYVDIGGTYVEGYGLDRTHTYLNETGITATGEINTGSVLGLIRRNQPFYSSSSSVNVNSTGIENARYGLCYMTINSINDYLVEESINNNGYEVFEWVSNLDLTGIFKTITTTLLTTYKYNFVKFEFINIIGNFPRDIASILEKILLNGTKVWFNYTPSNIV